MPTAEITASDGKTLEVPFTGAEPDPKLLSAALAHYEASLKPPAPAVPLANSQASAKPITPSPVVAPMVPVAPEGVAVSPWETKDNGDGTFDLPEGASVHDDDPAWEYAGLRPVIGDDGAVRQQAQVRRKTPPAVAPDAFPREPGRARAEATMALENMALQEAAKAAGGNNVFDALLKVRSAAQGQEKDAATAAFEAFAPEEQQKAFDAMAAAVARQGVQETREDAANDPVAKALATVSNAPRNFAQGAVTEGLRRYDAEYNAAAERGENTPGMGDLARAIFTDIPGNVVAGGQAVAANDGPDRISSVVPDLAENTLPGMAYNGLTAAGSDPIGLILPAVGEAGALTRPLTMPQKIAQVGEATKQILDLHGIARKSSSIERATQHIADMMAQNPVTASTAAPVSVAPPVAPVPPSPPSNFAELLAQNGAAPAPVAAGPLPSAIPDAPLAPAGVKAGARPSVSVQTSPGVFEYRPPAGSSLDGAPPAPVAAPVAPRMTPEPSPVVAGPAPGVVQTPAQKVFTNAAKAARTVGGGLRTANRVVQTATYGHLPLPLRHGLVLSVTRPKIGALAYTKGLRAFATDTAAKAVSSAIKNSKYAALYEEHGLSLPLREEQMSSAAEKLPLVGGLFERTSRASSTYLNALRSSAFDTTVDAWKAAGREPSKEELDALAGYINTASGRADLGKLEKYAPILQDAFAGPRYQWSRAKLLNPMEYAKMSPEVRKLAARDMASVYIAQASLLGVGKASGLIDTDLDPRSSDFGKFRIGKTSIDLSGGQNSYLRLAAVLATGQHKKSNGAIEDVSRPAEMWKFLEQRMGPLAGLADDAVHIGVGETDKTAAAKEALYKRSTLIMVKELRDAINEHGVIKGAALSVPAVPGASVQTNTDGTLWDDVAGAVKTMPGTTQTADNGQKGVVRVGENGSRYIEVPLHHSESQPRNDAGRFVDVPIPKRGGYPPIPKPKGGPLAPVMPPELLKNRKPGKVPGGRSG